MEEVSSVTNRTFPSYTLTTLRLSGQCAEENKAAAGGAAELDFAKVGGVFLLVGLGIGVGFLIAMFEFLWNVRRIAVKEKMTPTAAFMREIKFVLNFSVRTKPVQYSEESSLNRSRKSLTSSEDE